MIPVTKPYLPSKQKYIQYMNGIFERGWLTNNGPLLLEFEEKLKAFLNISDLLFVGNGTVALQVAIKSLGLKGEIITTPFSYVATTSIIVWEGCNPVFVDIQRESLNIDPSKIEASITSRTSAILATHCFGNACDIVAIQEIAEKHNLKVIYDAAHCFGTKYNGKSIFEFGDISTTSLHATKLMHSSEGGILFAREKALIERMAYMRNFGHDGPEKFNGVGINAKNSELHAAMGLCVLDDVNTIIERRKTQSGIYDELLSELAIQKPIIEEGCEFNYAYYPILFESEKNMEEVKVALELESIFARRYFYPSLSSLDYVKAQPTPIADDCASRILCIPLYHDLDVNDQRKISKIIINILQ